MASANRGAFANDMTGLIRVDLRKGRTKMRRVGSARESTELRMIRRVFEFLGGDVKTGIGYRHAGVNRSLEQNLFHITLF